ncbi:bifunctional folylpolyglutamate synthase/dihydrofolate synthase [Clostridium tyrobutyricum]|uniref:bifunctional folylpolyglutamate synthase/dihydrofolate synthase n=1 Tax=Clostridium tyrobutyricum TaxID=1519 RepID=UPI001C391038|nr:folylpolyglutamate synthase/dihydrofolate synthase family protein [Clostridium tyrobutyricum]MBV4431185.1 bifunctional folylpolyglutamate synthase/dihydrofolate synthase [Clostridium tyrobutyricum]
MNYQQALKYIHDTAKFGSNLGLERVQKLLEFLDNPQEKISIIHIAGTNGKGSVTAMISRILDSCGYKVGMYTSPHLEQFEERFQINEINISRNDLAECVTEVSKAVDKVIKLGYDNPTEFEIETCVMFYYFYKSKVDFAVVEVGLGGRLDATNVVQPFSRSTGGGVILSVITSISYDHMKILGDTLDKIAYEKAGIIKNGIPVALYPQEKSSEKVIKEVCMKRNCKLTKVPIDSVKSVQTSKINNSSSEYCQNIEVFIGDEVYYIKLSLLGLHQMLNCATAVYAARELIQLGIDIDKENLVSSLSTVKWMGRLEILNKNPLVVIDGAHNIQGIEALRNNIETYFEYKDIILILGILADKQVDKMIETIAPLAKTVIAVTPNSYRAESSDELNKIILKYNDTSRAFYSYEDAYREALSCADEDDIIVISGSLYMIGDMRKIIVNS